MTDKVDQDKKYCGDCIHFSGSSSDNCIEYGHTVFSNTIGCPCFKEKGLLSEHCISCLYYREMDGECSCHGLSIGNPQINWCSNYLPEKKQRTTHMQAKNKYHEIASKLADITEEKNKAYGNSVGDTPKILALLYPGGVPLDKYLDMLSIVRILDKIKRIATDKDALGESPYADILGYCLLRLNEDEMHQKGGDL